MARDSMKRRPFLPHSERWLWVKSIDCKNCLGELFLSKKLRKDASLVMAEIYS